ncbi:hypothetical protein [Ralstonia pseudosolanacearum]|uniref:hypothetical protein n=1 Tax=Ralstonia pseudosolanacearum TaxID=1310165 RepID=UPI00161C8490|nr:hypothetical protein [Ralstonia pseudosolanacearum]
MLYIVLCLTAALTAFAYFRRNSLTLWIAAVIALGWSVDLCAGAAWHLVRECWVRVFST